MPLWWRRANNQADGERADRTRRIQGKFCCTILKVIMIRLYLTRGPSLMKLFFFSSLTLCSHLPKMPLVFALLLYLSSPPSLALSLSVCAYLLFSHLVTFVWSLTALFSPCSSHPTSHLSVFLSAPGGLSHGGWYSERRFRLWVCRGNTDV